ncbi:MAG: flagellar biosynthetic protein FliO [Chromatiales bacterium]|jgi:flagellar protein FliO/FliZ
MMRSLLILLGCGSKSLLAAEPVERELTPLGVQSLLQTGGGLLLILLLIFVGAWLFKRYGQLPTLGKGLIRILGGVSVGPRERVMLLEVENTRLLVGVAPGQVRTLHILDGHRSETDFDNQLTALKQAESRGGGA